MDDRLFTINEVAKREGVYWETVSDLVKRHQIPTQPHPNCGGRTRAVDRAGYDRLRELLNSTAVETVPA
jgi:hypothetical protein